MFTGPSIAVDGAKSRRRLHLAPHLLLLAIAVLPCKVVDAQVHDCPINELSEHLNDIAEHCCPGNDCSATGYPTADATCSVQCGTELEPFWDSCSETLSLLGMLPDGLAQLRLKSCRAARDGASVEYHECERASSERLKKRLNNLRMKKSGKTYLWSLSLKNSRFCT